MCGCRPRKQRSYSSASMTRSGPCPARALAPHCVTMPPTIALGSCPSASSMTAIMAEVVVLPCVPATATARDPSSSRPSRVCRFITGMPAARAAVISGLASGTAEDTATNSAPLTCSARCPSYVRMPSAFSDRVTSLQWRSEPVTTCPRAASTRAMADIPIPPMPTICTCLGMLACRSTITTTRYRITRSRIKNTLRYRSRLSPRTAGCPRNPTGRYCTTACAVGENWVGSKPSHRTGYAYLSM